MRSAACILLLTACSTAGVASAPDVLLTRKTLGDQSHAIHIQVADRGGEKVFTVTVGEKDPKVPLEVDQAFLAVREGDKRVVGCFVSPERVKDGVRYEFFVAPTHLERSRFSFLAATATPAQRKDRPSGGGWTNYTAMLQEFAREPQSPLDALAPHASGVALAEVVGATEYDDRPMDGGKGVRFALKRVLGTGAFKDTIRVVTAPGGLRPQNSPPWKPSGPLKPDSLKKDERYWIAFSSAHEYEEYNQGVIGFWPEKDKGSEVLMAAVKDDVLRWSPQYVPDLRLSYGHIVEKDKWRVRGERDGKVLWEKALPGKPLEYHFGLFQSTGGSFQVPMPECGHILFTESDARLEQDNEFGLPAGPYYVNNLFDPVTGRRHGTQIRVAQASSVEVFNRAYDLDTGRKTREEQFDFPQTGGKGVGAKAEAWWRKTERTYDAAGKVTKEEVFWYDESAEKRWVRTKP